MMVVASSVFSPAERAVLEGLPMTQRMQGFYNCWTRKEAYIKAIGKGLAQPLDAFDVSLDPAAAAALRGAPDAPSRWSMQALPAPSGYAAALVVESGSYGPQLLAVPGTLNRFRFVLTHQAHIAIFQARFDRAGIKAGFRLAQHAVLHPMLQLQS